MDIISNLFPGYALKRELNKIRLKQVSRAYSGAEINDFYKYPSPTDSPNANLYAAGRTLRARARDFDENHDIVVGIFDALVQNIVGNSDPVRPMVRRPDGELHTELNIRLSRYWREWGIRPTTCGQYTTLQALKVACRAWLRDGEFLTRFHNTNTSTLGGIIPLSLELIDSDYLPFDKNEEKPSTIIQGVEVNKFNRPLAYHFYKKLPSDFYYEAKAEDTTRVDADSIVHVKFSRRTHQVRGVSILHPVITRLADLKDYEESERIAARVAAAMTGFIKKTGETMGAQTADGKRTFEMSPGMIFDGLLPGESIDTIASNRPNPGVADWRSVMLRAIASGTGTNYSTISKDYNGTYSSQRQELLESKPAYESMRQQFVDSYITPIWRQFVSVLVASNKLPLEGIDKETLDDIEMRGIDIGWIDPKKQADSIEISLRNKITSRQQVIRDQGGDPLAVFSEIEEEEKRFPNETELAPETAEDSEDNNGV